MLAHASNNGNYFGKVNNKDDATKIKQARAMLCDAIKDYEKYSDDDVKAFKEVTMHLILIRDYKMAAQASGLAA